MKKEAEERARREEIEQKEREAKRLQEEEEKKARYIDLCCGFSKC